MKLQQLLSYARKAIDDYHMIEEGDRIAIGISGGAYVMRNMVWTEGIFVANDFWRGVKLNYKNALQQVTQNWYSPSV